MVSEGKKTAKATAIRLAKTGNGAVLFEIRMDFVENGVNENLIWKGFLKSGDGSTAAFERTVLTMREVLEYDGSQETVNVPENDPRKGMLVNQDAINRKKEVQIVVKHRPWTDKQGNSHIEAEIQWINVLGGGGHVGLSPTEAQNELGSIGFKAMFQGLKNNKPKEPTPAAAPAPAFQESDLPY